MQLILNHNFYFVKTFFVLR